MVRFNKNINNIDGVSPLVLLPASSDGGIFYSFCGEENGGLMLNQATNSLNINLTSSATAASTVDLYFVYASKLHMSPGAPLYLSAN